MWHKVMDEIYAASVKFLDPLDPEQIFKTVVEEAVKLTRAKEGSILLVDSGKLERVYATSPALYKIKPRRRGIMYNVFKTGKPVVLSSQEVMKIHPEFENVNVNYDIVYPLSYRNKSIGVLSILFLEQREFETREFRILKYFAPLATLAIRNAQLYSQLKEALTTRDLFIAMAAHELRTPLTAMNGYIQLLSRRLSSNSGTELKWTENLRYEAKRLTTLINDFLTINLIQTGKFSLSKQACSLVDIIERAITEFNFSYPKHTVVFNKQKNIEEDLVEGDFDKLVQVITNIFSNSAKFSQPTERINITVTKDDSHFSIYIEDKGKGIQKKDIGYIFESYYKGKDNEKSGMGLGLYVAKNIITQHKGKIRVASEPNEGTTIHIALPIFEATATTKELA